MIRTLCLVAIALCATTVIHSRSSSEREVHAGTALALRMSDLVDRSQTILEGRVIDKRAFRAANGGIETEYRLSVARSFLSTTGSNATGEAFTFRTPGGVLPDGRGMFIAGLPELACGEDAVVFLTGESAQGTRMPVGLAQGKFSVVVDARGVKGLVRDARGLDLVDARGARVRDALQRATYDYTAVTAEIESLVRTRAQREASAGKGR